MFTAWVSPTLTLDIEASYPSLFTGMWPFAVLPDGGVIFSTQMGNDRYVYWVSNDGMSNNILYLLSFPIANILIKGEDMLLIKGDGNIHQVNMGTGNLVDTYVIPSIGTYRNGIMLYDMLMLGVDKVNGEVFTFDLGTNTKEIKVSGMTQPFDVAFHNDSCNGRAYYAVTDKSDNIVNVYDGNWSLVTSFGGFGTAPGQFRAVQDIALSTNNTLLIMDTNNDRVQEFSIEGEFVREIAGSGWALEFNFPHFYRLYTDTRQNIRSYQIYEV